MSKKNIGIETTQIESLKSVFDLILCKNNSEQEIMDKLSFEIALHAALRGFPVLMRRSQVRELLGIGNNTIAEAHKNLNRNGFPLMRGDRWTSTHAVILLNETNKMT